MSQTVDRKSGFRLGSVGAGSSLLFIVLLMLYDWPLTLTFSLVVLYGVVPISMWRRLSGKGWRVFIVLTCLLGYGIIGLVFLYELWVAFFGEEGSSSITLSTHLVALFAGIIFLPLSLANIFQRLFQIVARR